MPHVNVGGGGEGFFHGAGAVQVVKPAALGERLYGGELPVLPPPPPAHPKWSTHMRFRLNCTLNTSRMMALVVYYSMNYFSTA